MLQVASTITEHYFLIGFNRGFERGLKRSKIKGKIETLQEFYAEGMIPEPLFRERIKILKQQLQDLTTQSDSHLKAHL